MLDKMDRNILAILQRDCTMPVAEIGRQVGLSTTPCWRRIQKMEDQEIIQRRVALLDCKKINAGVTVFVSISTSQHEQKWLDRFHEVIRKFPEVVEFYRMSGQVALDAAFTYAWSYQHFPEQLTEEGLEPHRVEQALMWGSEDPDVFVDIGPYLGVKVDSLGAHVSQMSSSREERLERVMNGSGRHKELTGLEYTEGFRRITFNLGSLEWRLLHT